MRKRLSDWTGDPSLPFAVALSILLHACAFLVSDLLFPEAPERREFKVRLTRAPTVETKRFVGKRVKIPRRMPMPYIGPEGPKGAPEGTGPAAVAPTQPGSIRRQYVAR